MNSIVLNGKRSQDIDGLLIQELPCISKPPMRTKVETVDGRDGDIVTPLGYDGYDKVASIGLYGKYKIDDIIEFFSGEGTVIFSNEPDKYYKYAIYNQIDFERLIRFRTAEVTFHVQPFKYSAVERVKTFEPKKDKNNKKTVIIRNNGNTISRPKITLHFSEPLRQRVTVNINNAKFVLYLVDAKGSIIPKSITLDGENLNAYDGDILLNRFVIGNFEEIVFERGINHITIEATETGTSDVDKISTIEVENYSRWI